MKNLHSFGWYAAKISKHLPKEAFTPVPSRLIGGLLYLLVCISGISLIGLTNLPIFLNLAVTIIIGFCFAGLGFLGHEILHGTVVKTPWLRDLLGALAFWPLNTGPQLWRKWHNMTHHVHTQHDDLDPDSWPSISKITKMKMFRWVYHLPQSVRSTFAFLTLAIQFSAHSIKCFQLYIKEFQPRKRPKVWIQAILPWTTWIGLLVLMGWESWIFAYLLPLLIANFIVMSYISTNHRLNPLTDVNDPLANSLTVTVPKWVDVLHFNFSYHTEHHIFPAMSPKYYPLVKQHIKAYWPDRYHEMPMHKALIALWKTPRVYYEDKDFVDPKEQRITGSLGNGLNVDNIQFEKIELTSKSIVKDNLKNKSDHAEEM